MKDSSINAWQPGLSPIPCLRILDRPRLHNLSTDCFPAHVNWYKEDQDETEAFNYGLMDYLQ